MVFDRDNWPLKVFDRNNWPLKVFDCDKWPLKVKPFRYFHDLPEAIGGCGADALFGGGGGADALGMGSTAATLLGGASMPKRSPIGAGTLDPLHLLMAETPQTRAVTIVALAWGVANSEALRAREMQAITPTQIRVSSRNCCK